MTNRAETYCLLAALEGKPDIPNVHGFSATDSEISLLLLHAETRPCLSPPYNQYSTAMLLIELTDQPHISCPACDTKQIGNLHHPPIPHHQQLLPPDRHLIS